MAARRWRLPSFNGSGGDATTALGAREDSVLVAMLPGPLDRPIFTNEATKSTRQLIEYNPYRPTLAERVRIARKRFPQFSFHDLSPHQMVMAKGRSRFASDSNENHALSDARAVAKFVSWRPRMVPDRTHPSQAAAFRPPIQRKIRFDRPHVSPPPLLGKTGKPGSK
jgi:hypothetical protein